MTEVPRDLSGAKLDHVMVMVHDLGAASEDFGRLGFRVRPGSRFPVGIENATIRFGVGGPYLELVSVHEAGRPEVRDNVEFLAKGEGAMYVGLEVASAAGVADRLRGLGFEVAGPEPGWVKPEGWDGPSVMVWQSVTIPHGASPRSDPLFFTEYNRAGQAELAAKLPDYRRRWGEEPELPHPNGADDLVSVWFAVRDLEREAVRYERLGLRRTREYALDQLRCRVVELAVGRGTLRLMESVREGGPIDQLLSRHATQLEVPGVSLGVPDVKRAVDAMPPGVATTVEPSDDRRGRAVVIPPGDAHGLWLELLERPGGSP